MVWLLLVLLLLEGFAFRPVGFLGGWSVIHPCVWENHRNQALPRMMCWSCGRTMAPMSSASCAGQGPLFSRGGFTRDRCIWVPSRAGLVA